MKQVVFHPEAWEEFDNAVAYYESCLAGLGVDLRMRVEQSVSQIRQHPLRFAFLRDTGFRAARLKRFPYSVVYLEMTETIWIAAIANERRHPDYWRKRRLADG